MIKSCSILHFKCLKEVTLKHSIVNSVYSVVIDNQENITNIHDVPLKPGCFMVANCYRFSVATFLCLHVYERKQIFNTSVAQSEGNAVQEIKRNPVYIFNGNNFLEI